MYVSVRSGKGVTVLTAETPPIKKSTSDDGELEL